MYLLIVKNAFKGPFVGEIIGDITGLTKAPTGDCVTLPLLGGGVE
jgi:hypothetical protein